MSAHVQQDLAVPAHDSEPTRLPLTKDLCVRAEHGVEKVGTMRGVALDGRALVAPCRHPLDVPGPIQKGDLCRQK